MTSLDEIDDDQFSFDGAGVIVDLEDLSPGDPTPKTTVAPTAAPKQNEMRVSHNGQAEVTFDLETIPDYDRMALFGLEPLPEPPKVTPVGECPDIVSLLGGTLAELKTTLSKINPPADWLDAVVTQEALAKKPRAGVGEAVDDCRQTMAKYQALVDDRRLLLSTTPEFCRICALGVAIGNDPVMTAVLGQPMRDDDNVVWSELAMLDALWKAIKISKPLVGFNILHFDIPVVYARTAILGANYTRRLDLRPWGGDVKDIYLERFPKGNTDKRKPGKLKLLAPLYGIQVPAGDVDGSQVEELWKTNPNKLGEYVGSDVEITRALRQKWRGLFVS